MITHHQEIYIHNSLSTNNSSVAPDTGFLTNHMHVDPSESTGHCCNSSKSILTSLYFHCTYSWHH